MRLLAGALCLALALTVAPEAGAGHGTPGGPDRAARAAPAADRPYGEAAVTRRYEAARRAVVLRRAAVRGERHRLAGPYYRTGRSGRAPYRAGGPDPVARLTASVGAPRVGAPRVGAPRVGAPRVGGQTAGGALRSARRAVVGRTVTRKATWAQRPLPKPASAGPLRPPRHRRAAGCPGGTAHARPSRYQPAGGQWVAPVGAYTLTAGFAAGGRRWARRHTGQDLAVPVGTPVVAVGTGTVVLAGCGDGFGNQIVLRHPNGYFTHYAHLDVIEVAEGDRVRTGQRVALSGDTGNSTGPHLHFEVRVTPLMGSAVDPVRWLRARGVGL